MGFIVISNIFKNYLWLGGFNFVNNIERLTTISAIIKSTIISKGLLASNIPTRPNIQIAIKIIGNTYLIMKTHFLPTLNVENSFK